MLQNIRNWLQGWLAWVVVGIIAVPLVLSFITTDYGISGTEFAARVNGEEVPSVEFQRRYQDQLLAEQQAAKGQLTPEAEEKLKKQTLDSLVLNRLVTQFVNEQGYRVGNQRVAEYIRSLPVFQVAGQFSKPAYDAMLGAQGLSPEAFESDQRSFLTVRQLQEGLADSAFFTPAEFRRLIALDQERRDVTYVLFDPAALTADLSVTDAEIEAYYAANSTQFMSPETVDLEYVEVALGDLDGDYEPDEAALRQAYEADPTRFKSAEERQARHILVTVADGRSDAEARALAEDVAKQLAAGGDFATLAAKYSNDPGSASRGGDLGFAPRGVYAAPFEEALFALKPGETSPPVKTEFGYHIIRLEAVRAGTEQGFEQVRPQLTEELRRQKTQDDFIALAERMDDLALENPGSLEPVATGTGLAIKRLTGYTRSGGGPFGNNPNMLSAVFSDPVLEGGENTPLVELDETRAVIARVAAHKQPAPRPLAELRDEIIKRIRAAQGQVEARARGEALIKQQQAGGGDLGQVARASGFTAVESGPVTRRSPTVPPDLLAAMFRVAQPATGVPAVQGVALPDGTFAVFQVGAIVPGEPGQIPREQRDQRKQILAQRMSVAEAEALAGQLRETADVVVARDLFKVPEGEDL